MYHSTNMVAASIEIEIIPADYPSLSDTDLHLMFPSTEQGNNVSFLEQLGIFVKPLALSVVNWIEELNRRYPSETISDEQWGGPDYDSTRYVMLSEAKHLP